MLALSVTEPGRGRASSRGLSTDEQDSETVSLIHDFRSLRRRPDAEECNRLSNAATKLGNLVSSHVPAKDIFRRGGGFENSLELLDNFSNPDDPQREDGGRSPFTSSRLIKSIIRLLTEALRDHRGNQKYFGLRLEGWNSLWQALENFHISLLKINDSELVIKVAASLYDSLLALALNHDEFDVLSKRLQDSTLDTGSFDISSLTLEQSPTQATLHNPQACAIVVHFIVQVFDSSTIETSNVAQSLLANALQLILALVNHSCRNTIALWQTDAHSDLLEALLSQYSMIALKPLLEQLVLHLGQYGFRKLDDVALLLKQAATDSVARNILSTVVKKSKSPGFVQFEMMLCGYSAIELPALPRPFPPPAGYTLTAWIRIDEFDPDSHTTLFGCYDRSHKSFVLMYLEKDSRQLILQTSVRSSNPSVRFKSTAFLHSKWYHLALVHRKNVADPSQSMALLFINGSFAEQKRCAYPELADELEDTARSASSATHMDRKTKHVPVQAFFGTPQNIAPPGQKNIKSIWSLANGYLYQTPLTDDFIAIQYRLSPRYYGNLQDCLGPLLTYRASFELHRHNELLHPDRCDKSDIVIATEQRGSDVAPESFLQLGINPFAIIDCDSLSAQNVNFELDHAAMQKYQKLVRKARTIAINTAIPALNEAIGHTFGTGAATGDPVVVIPQPLDDAIWRLSGCLPNLFRLLESANSRATFIQSVEIFFECAKDNWRISEVMEQGNAYGALALIIREKLGFETVSSSHAPNRKPSAMLNLEDRQAISRPLLEMILHFVGYNNEQPEDSMLVNPMAYRTLLVDFDTWRRSDFETQTLYWTQFVHFVHRNAHQNFNQKRITRMRVLKKLVESLKGEEIFSDTAELIKTALKALLDTYAQHKIYRDLAMFVAFGLHDGRAMSTSGMRHMASVASFRQKAGAWARSARPSRPDTPEGSPAQPIRQGMSRQELAVLVLGLLADTVCNDRTNVAVRRFNKDIPDRCLLHLLSENDVRVTELALSIICREMIALGSEFKARFVDKNGGFIILKARLKPFWRSPTVWAMCFAILLGRTLPFTTFADDFTAFQLLRILRVDEKLAIVNPEILPTIFALVESGLRNVANHEETSDADANTIKAVIQFFGELFSRSLGFREFAAESRYTQELLFVLFPLLTGSDRLSAEMEIHSDKGALSFNGEAVKMRPHSNSQGERPPSVRSLNVDNGKRTPSPMAPSRIEAPRRMSSFVFIKPAEGLTKGLSPHLSSSSKNDHGASMKINTTNALVESLMELAITLFIHQICHKEKFNGIGLFLKVPPGFQEHQAYFESYLLVNALSQLSSHLRLNQKLLVETRVLTNVSRYIQQLAEAVSEGWFIDGAQPLLDFAGEILEHLQEPEIASLKSVRLCSQSTNAIRIVFLKMTLWRLSALEEDASESDAAEFLRKMTYWQTILFSAENQEILFTKLICYLLYQKLVSNMKSVRLEAARLWRMVLVQKPTETATLLTYTMGSEQRHLSTGFMRLISMDDDDFLSWVDENRASLDSFFRNSLSKSWDDFINNENASAEVSYKSRVNKRRERLRQWQTEETTSDEFLHRYEVSTNHWRANVHAQERVKLQRAMQDHQENINHLHHLFSKAEKVMNQPDGHSQSTASQKWQLDETEALNRMRMRLIPDNTGQTGMFQSKRKFSERRATQSLALNTTVPRLVSDDIMSPLPGSPAVVTPGVTDGSHDQNDILRARRDSTSNSQLLEGGFEMVEDPKEDEDGIIEDKNRKVMTSLQRGDMVQQLYNISRIVGLEACEGLLIVGRNCLYMQDNFFQRSDGEIVSVSQAPEDERDPYVQLISGKDVSLTRTKHSIGDQETRSWIWSEVLSISKRRFLLRDVSVEIFFTDGRSYLITCMSSKARDDLYKVVVDKAPHVHSTSGLATEDAWRLDTLRNPEEVPQSLGSKFGNLFNSTPTHAATKKWMRGEMSNFQYLMLVNTMAGRTFNDLTQYPVFPWVLADYTSEELDFNNPKTFRDFSKPMGCQTEGRAAEYRDRFQQFAEMGDHNAPAFHYGTHYSSAMIVSSYLIRLQPFVQSYLLLQGDSFDHADRLFDSIEKAWASASRENMSDVRELTPEFFYLPEFLSNTNKYDFGTKQATGEAVNDVQLPKWAKGDPHIFIAKHREALESPYVSQHLHEWIDLIFGYKQRGEAAIEATNVFQHLSYGGAKDLDKIDDQMERLATIGIIHSFGQTPYQVFPRQHPYKELDRAADSQLDSLVESLIRLPSVILKTNEKVATLTYSPMQERLLCSAPGKLNVSTNSDRYLQWGFADHSIRFFSSHSKRLLGLYENTHIGPVTSVTFVDSKTLVTAGMDCTIGIWTVNVAKDVVDIQSKQYLFGHRNAVTLLTASRVFSTLLSASSDGHALLWGLNRCNCIRTLVPPGGPRIQAARISNVSGHILLCRGSKAELYTLNGHLLVEQKLCERNDEEITSCAFYEGTGNEYMERELIFTGHSHGVANVWALTTLSDGAWHLQLVKRLNHFDPSRPGEGGLADITAILPMSRAVYTGDEEGNVWEWDCIQRQGSSLHGR